MTSVFQAPPCACKEFCVHSFRGEVGPDDRPFPAYSEALLDADAKAIAHKHNENIWNSYRFLDAAWRQFGKSIVKKWRNMNAKKKEDFLLKLHPNINKEEHFSFLEHSGAYKDQNVLPLRPLYMAEYINLPGLKDDSMKLLVLLQNRTQSTPTAWARYDNSGLDYPWTFHKFEVKFSNLCMLMQKSGVDEYGTLTAWDREQAHRGEMIGFPRAELLLEKQVFVYTFLAGVVQSLMEGRQLGESSAVPEQIKLEMTNRGRNDLCSAYTNHVYSESPDFSLHLMISKAQAQVDLYEDRLWLLQTDAAYLRDTIELGKGALSSEYSKMERYREAAMLISLDIWNYWSWCLILKAYQNVYQVGSSVANNIVLGQPLPQQYEKALQELEFVLKAHTDDRLAILCKTLAERPAFGHYFQQFAVPEAHDRALPSGTSNLPGRGIVAFVDYFGRDFLKEDRLFYALQTLSSANIREHRGLVDTANRWAYLDEVLAGHKAEDDISRFDTELFEMYNSFAAADEMHFNFQFHYPKPTPVLKDAQRPRYSREESAALGRPTVLSYEADKVFKQECQSHFHTKAPQHLQTFVEAYDKHLKDAKRDDQKRLQQLDAIDTARTEFWNHHVETRKTVLKAHGSLDDSEISEDLQLISAYKDPKNFEDGIAERQRIQDRIDAKLGPKHTQAGPSSEWAQSEPEQSLVSVKGKEKVKTRPEEVDRQPELPDIDALAIALEVEERIQLIVSKKTLDLLAKMLSTGEEKIKDVDWNNFVSAMVEVGFIATSNGGSMVYFEPMKDHPLGWKGHIVFHRPHPQAKIRQRWLRGFSTRLARHFAWWQMDTFVERKKVEQDDE